VTASIHNLKNTSLVSNLPVFTIHTYLKQDATHADHQELEHNMQGRDDILAHCCVILDYACIPTTNQPRWAACRHPAVGITSVSVMAFMNIYNTHHAQIYSIKSRM
jgi:hypothetical protein